MNPTIGIDLDNTIINYDKAFFKHAVQNGLITPDVPAVKKAIRTAVRKCENGEAKWRELQATVYGPEIGAAELMPGVLDFFEFCQRHHVAVYIISHKTRYASLSHGQTDLRQAALSWMSQNGLFSNKLLGLSEKRVFFEQERRFKIARVRAQKCTHFIDDLQETFREQFFPRHVQKILFSPEEDIATLHDIKVFSHWKILTEFFFDARN